MKKINYLSALFGIVLILLTFHNSFSQVNHDWVARYNGPGNDYDVAYSIAMDGSGNVYVTGFSYGSLTGYDYVTIKYNSVGDSVWIQRYDGPGNSTDEAKSIAVESSGNVYVTGFSYGTGTASDYATIKYNSSGVQQWVARYNGPGNSIDDAGSIAVDGSGNVYVTGTSYGSGTVKDYATIKYNSAGVQQWVARYNGSGNYYDEAKSIEVDGSGNVYVTGTSYGSGINPDYATIKYNSSGVQQWQKLYTGPGDSYDYATSLSVDSLSNVYVTGVSTGNGTAGDYATIKYNSSGDSVWVKRYNGPGDSTDYASSLAIDATGNVYVTGGSTGSGTAKDYATIKYNSEGVQKWVARYNGPENSWDEAKSIAVDGSGNVYVTGGSKGSGTEEDYATIKYNSSGVQQWTLRYDGPGNSGDGAVSIAEDGLGNVCVTGVSIGSGTSYDYATIKYSQFTGIEQISSIIPEQFSISQNYPNPFNPVTNLEFGISDLGFVTLKVYDILGKEVITLVNEKLSPGKYKVEFDGSGLSSGVYFYRLVVSLSNPLTSGKFTDVKRMILTK